MSSGDVRTGREVRLGGRWRLWDQIALRGPGFPADGVLALVPDGLAAEADRVEAGGEQEFAGRFGDAAVKTSRALQEIAGSSSFREALAWQNRAVLRTGIAPFLAWSPSAAGRTSMPRQREELVAHYWQRFCVKNDTIGFFGPVGWGRLDPAADGVRVAAGEGLISGSELYFSGWALDTLAAAVAGDPALRGWTAPRRVPFVIVDPDGADGLGTTAVPGCRPRPLPPHAAQVLALCDGVRPARDIASALPGVDTDAVLLGLVARRVLTWRLELPADTHPERHLRAWLDGVGDPDARGRGTALLDELERGRERLRAADGPDALSAAMAGLEESFAAVTGSAATRNKGAAPCRALVYSDAVRSARVTLGADVLAALAPVELLLDSAAWMTAELAARVGARITAVHDRLRAEAGAPVDLATLWFAVMGVLHEGAVTDAHDVRAELQRRWGQLLGPIPGRRVHRAGADLAAGVAELFPARPAAWDAARYLSPDVMLVPGGSGSSDADGGGVGVVLGELHVAANTLGSSLFVHQHPDPDELLAATTRDHPGPRLVPLPAKEHRARLSVRTRNVLLRPEDYQVALVDDVAHRDRTVASSQVRVERRGGELVAVLPDGAQFPLLDVFGHVLTTRAMDLFQILPEAPRTPRVTIDDCVVARETWRFPTDALGFAAVKDEAQRFVAARRWREAHDLPRFVFVTCPTEPRPFFVDFDAPVYCGILAKAARRLARAEPGGTLTVTEMLPTPEQAWLTDDQGRRYTSELRLVAVDDPR